MMFLLTADWHLDENEDNEYRWKVFGEMHRILDEHPAVTAAFQLGDFVDRKDRFSSRFVNRLLGELRGIGERIPFYIMRGNHDFPLRGPSYFEFVDARIPWNVHYVTKPTPVGDVILLPYAADPVADWRGIDWTEFEAAFLHVTPDGAISESGFQLSGRALPKFPKSLKLYTGDVHNPQVVRGFTVVGCPHPVKFGDRFQPRMLLLDEDTLDIVEEVPIDTVRKLSVDVCCIDDLHALQSRRGDQVRVRINLSSGDVERTGEVEREVADWARSNGVVLSGTEIVVETGSLRGASESDADPEELLRRFAAKEEMSDELLDLGLDLMREAKG